MNDQMDKRSNSGSKQNGTFELYNLIKQQVPKKLFGRNASVGHRRLNATLPPDQNSAISISSNAQCKLFYI